VIKHITAGDWVRLPESTERGYVTLVFLNGAKPDIAEVVWAGGRTSHERLDDLRRVT
jgi:hypothetical protein